ncbi:MAG: response regulator transcription factor [Bacteroidetes bacterium]|nr:response regulator transcription factor [Bacteroidota bacterium]MDA1335281.1 response regulator transcription factor [Bacteroidota bacterium]
METMTPQQPRILLAEDDPALRKALKLNFNKEGWFVIEASNGEEALNHAKQHRLDVAVLDVMMPKLDGIAVCKTLRSEGSDLPILFLTAKNDGEDRVEGLKSGGDEYLGKPFHLEELLLRIRRLMRRQSTNSPEVISFYQFKNGAEIDFDAFEIKTLHGEARRISKRESMLLRLLISKKEQVVSREEILEVVWGYHAFPSTRTIDNHLVAFRKYFEKDPKFPEHFVSIRGVGYRFSEK